MSREEIEEEVLRPMQRVFLPPRHLRYHNYEDPDAKDEALEQYYQVLSGYDRATLQKAWQRVRAEHDFSIWPTPAKLAQAAELSLPRPRPPSELALREQRAMDRAEGYATSFMKRRKVARPAREEGWAADLRAYVYAAAWVQAQLIDGLDREGITLPRDLTRHAGCRSTAEALAWCREEFASQVEAGEIEVRVPKGLVEQWKQEAAARGSAPPSPALHSIMERLRQREVRASRTRS